MQIKDFTDEAIANKVKKIKERKDINAINFNLNNNRFNKKNTLTHYNSIKKPSSIDKNSNKFNYTLKTKSPIPVILLILLLIFVVFCILGYLMYNMFQIT